MIERYKENKIHGTAFSPFARYRTDINETMPFCPIHWHEEMEIIKLESGTGDFCIDGNWHTAYAGDIIILRPFAMHSINRHGNETMTIDAVVFNLRMLETNGADACNLKYFAPILNVRNAVPYIVRPTDKWYEAINMSLSAILTADETQAGYELEVKANLYWIFYHMYSNRLLEAVPDVTEDKRIYTVKKALEYIRANYMNDISVSTLSKVCGYSEFYLMKLFKKFTGLTCVEYVNNYRLDVAAGLLKETDDEVSAVAFEVGFNNVSYFNRRFLKQFGTTPKVFRSNK